MHEVGIMEQTLARSEALAREHGGGAIQTLRLRVGEWSGVDVEALRLAFFAAAPGTLAERATLAIEVAEARLWCERCHDEFFPGDQTARCPVCGAISRDLRAGNELDLVELELEDLEPGT